MTWFARFAPREQFLIGLAALLTVVLMIWQFIISPILSGTESAERELAAAKRDYVIVSAGLPKMKAQGGTQKSGFDRNAVIETARTANVSISRMQPAADDSLQVWLDDSPALSVYTFLSELERRYSTSTRKAQITRKDDGTVAAQFTFEPQ